MTIYHLTDHDEVHGPGLYTSYINVVVEVLPKDNPFDYVLSFRTTKSTGMWWWRKTVISEPTVLVGRHNNASAFCLEWINDTTGEIEPCYSVYLHFIACVGRRQRVEGLKEAYSNYKKSNAKVVP